MSIDHPATVHDVSEDWLVSILAGNGFLGEEKIREVQDDRYRQIFVEILRGLEEEMWTDLPSGYQPAGGCQQDQECSNMILEAGDIALRCGSREPRGSSVCHGTTAAGTAADHITYDSAQYVSDCMIESPGGQVPATDCVECHEFVLSRPVEASPIVLGRLSQARRRRCV